VNANTARPANRTQVNWWVDLAIFSAVMLALAPQFTGLSVHEWLGLGLAAGLAVHLLLHWQWLVSVIRRFFGQIPWSARLNLLLNTALFIDLVIVIFTGVMISREALPLLGLAATGGREWESLHAQAADLSLIITGLHVAVHWKWLLSAARRYVAGPLVRWVVRNSPQPKAAPVAVIGRPEGN